MGETIARMFDSAQIEAREEKALKTTRCSRPDGLFCGSCPTNSMAL